MAQKKTNKEINIISSTSTLSTACDFFTFKGKTFKASAFNNGSYSRLHVEVMMPNGDFALIACDKEIEGYIPVDSLLDFNRQKCIDGLRHNVEVGTRFVVKLYNNA